MTYFLSSSSSDDTKNRNHYWENIANWPYSDFIDSDVGVQSDSYEYEGASSRLNAPLIERARWFEIIGHWELVIVQVRFHFSTHYP